MTYKWKRNEISWKTRNNIATQTDNESKVGSKYILKCLKCQRRKRHFILYPDPKMLQLSTPDPSHNFSLLVSSTACPSRHVKPMKPFFGWVIHLGRSFLMRETVNLKLFFSILQAKDARVNNALQTNEKRTDQHPPVLFAKFIRSQKWDENSGGETCCHVGSQPVTLGLGYLSPRSWGRLRPSPFSCRKVEKRSYLATAACLCRVEHLNSHLGRSSSGRCPAQVAFCGQRFS